MSIYKIIALLFLIAISCKEKSQIKETPILLNDTIYPSLAHVCFTQENETGRFETFKLGDSLIKVLKFLDLDTNFGPSYPLSKPIIEKGKHGICTIRANAHFKFARLNSIDANWEYICDTTRAARLEFFKFITHHAMRCFWEEGPDTFNKNQDTLHSGFFDNREYILITDLRTNPWKANFRYGTKQ